MQIDLDGVIRNLERSVGLIPGVVVVVTLLAGPTILWLLYRFVVQPRTSRYVSGDADLLWICERCRSANQVRRTSCYRCGLAREAIVGDLQVFDGDGLVTLAPETPPGVDRGDTGTVPAPAQPGPGIPVMAPAGSVVGAAVIATPPVVEPAPGPQPELPAIAAAPPRRMVAVGPGRGGAARDATPAATRDATKAATPAATNEAEPNTVTSDAEPTTADDAPPAAAVGKPKPRTRKPAAPRPPSEPEVVIEPPVGV